MSENGPSRTSVARGAGALLVLVVLLNVLPRLVSLPSIDAPALALPDLPDVPGWVRKLVKIKNWVLLGIAVLVVVGFVAEEIEKHRARRAPDTEGEDEGR